MRGQPLKLTGRRFGRLVAVARVPGLGRSIGKAYWQCLCDCGARSVVQSGDLCNGTSRSCGCLAFEMFMKRSTTHGRSQMVEYRIWIGMKNRCFNPKFPPYRRYGAKGVSVCSRWASSFTAFLEDMGRRPSPRHSVDRFPNRQGNYEPGNCRWATPKEQSRNKVTNRFVVVANERMTIAEASERYGVRSDTICKRLNRGWPDGRAVRLGGQEARRTTP